MNEFTKEELKYMIRGIYFEELEYHLENDIPEFAVNLMKKLKSMIDNYCEHNQREVFGNDSTTM